MLIERHASLTTYVHHLLTHTTGATHHLVVAGLYGVAVLCVWLIWKSLQSTIMRLWLGKWSFSSDTGEYHRVLGHDHHGEMIDSRSQIERRGEALNLRQERHGKIIASVVLGVVGFLILRDWWHGAATFHRWFGTGPLCWTAETFGVFFSVSGLIAAAFMLLGNGVMEGLYLTNFAHMAGARVFDPPARMSPGADTLIDDDIYTTGGPADPDDIGDAYGDDGRKAAPPRFKD